MDEEVKRRRKEKEQQAVEQRLAEERMRKMEQDNKHLLANLFSQKPMINQSLVQSLAQTQILKQKLSQNALQRTQTGSISQLQRMQAQTKSALQQPSQNITMLSLQRNSSQSQQRTHNSWPNNSTTTNNGPLPNMVSLASNLSQFYPQSFLPSFPQLKNPPLPLHQTALSSSLSSKNPLDEILDLTVSSPSPSPDTTEGRLNLDSLTRHSAAFEDDFNLESLISQNVPNAQHAAQIQQPLLLQQQQQQPLQATQQQNHNLLANNHQDLIDFFDLSLSPQMSTQKASPSSSTSSGSSSMSSTSSVSNSLVSHVPAGLLPVSTLIPASSSSSSLFSSASSSTSLFSNSSSHFSPPYLLPQSDPLSLPNGHCSTTALDVREALNSMLQAGPDRKSVIQYRNQD